MLISDNMKVYISGKISGMPLDEAKKKFQESSYALLLEGHDPVNPIGTGEKTWKEYLLEDIAILFDCDAIYMQKDWGQSKGARIEYAVAKELGLLIMHEK